MDSAASSIELIFQSYFEIFNRKFAGLQQKKRFYVFFIFETYKKTLFGLVTPIIKLLSTENRNVFNNLHKSPALAALF
jgi:hypothetical protein